MSEKSNKNQIILVLIVAALGYFVDIYDLVLFGVVKGESLQQIMSNESPEQIASTGKFLFKYVNNSSEVLPKYLDKISFLSCSVIIITNINTFYL